MSATEENSSDPIYSNVKKKLRARKESEARHGHATAASLTPVLSSHTTTTQRSGSNTTPGASSIAANRTNEKHSIELSARYKALVTAAEDGLRPDQILNGDDSGISAETVVPQKRSYNKLQIVAWLILSVVLLLQTLAFIVAIASSYQQMTQLRTELDLVTEDTSDQLRQVEIKLTSLMAAFKTQMFVFFNQTTRQDGLQESLSSAVAVIKDEVSTLREALNVLSVDINTLKKMYNEIRHHLSELATDTNKNISNLKQDIELKHMTTEGSIQILATSLPLGRDSDYAVDSCRSLALLRPSFSPGHYWVRCANGSACPVYCVSTPDCGDDIQGIQGWQRISHLTHSSGNNMAQCFEGLINGEGKTSWCVQGSEEPGCSHTVFSTNVNYSYVCASIIGYGIKTPDGSEGAARTLNPALSSNYVDGISFTYNTTSSEMKHIWTLASQVDSNILCNQFPEGSKFPGANFTCLPIRNTLTNLSDCLEDSTDEDCQPKTFFRDLQVIKSDIQMRLCRDQEREDEDTAIYKLDVYVTKDVSTDLNRN